MRLWPGRKRACEHERCRSLVCLDLSLAACLSSQSRARTRGLNSIHNPQAKMSGLARRFRQIDDAHLTFRLNAKAGAACKARAVQEGASCARRDRLCGFNEEVCKLRPQQSSCTDPQFANSSKGGRQEVLPWGYDCRPRTSRWGEASGAGIRILRQNLDLAAQSRFSSHEGAASRTFSAHQKPFVE